MRIPLGRSLPRSLLLAWVASACSTWMPMAHPATEPRPLPPQVRVTLTSGERVLLDDPFMTPDSLSGTLWRGRYRSFAVADVTQVERMRLSWKQTGLAVGALAGIIALGRLTVDRLSCDVACAR
jgi:hypothetical protein